MQFNLPFYRNRPVRKSLPPHSPGSAAFSSNVKVYPVLRTHLLLHRSAERGCHRCPHVEIVISYINLLPLTANLFSSWPPIFTLDLWRWEPPPGNLGLPTRSPSRLSFSAPFPSTRLNMHCSKESGLFAGRNRKPVQLASRKNEEKSFNPNEGKEGMRRWRKCQPFQPSYYQPAIMKWSG